MKIIAADGETEISVARRKTEGRPEPYLRLTKEQGNSITVKLDRITAAALVAAIEEVMR